MRMAGYITWSGKVQQAYFEDVLIALGRPLLISF